jgi:soluble calcium-activated nucleotidase 1
MFTELPATSSRGSGYHSSFDYYGHHEPPPKKRTMMGPFTQLHARHKQVVGGLVVLFFVVGAVLYLNPTMLTDGVSGSSVHSRGLKDASLQACLRYPLQQSYHKYDPSSTQYNIVIVADMDKESKTEDKKWKSVLKSGTLTRHPDTKKYTVAWESDLTILSVFNDGSRGMELSELAFFNDQLFTFDDRTGIVYFVEGDKVIPKHILMDGNGRIDKGLKIEWATVKDDHLYVGSTGKEWTTPKGEFVNNNPQWVARIDAEGRIDRLDWSNHYTALRKVTDTMFPGYLLHEGVRWNAALRRWFFLPRRVSKEPYDESLDEERGSNTVISMNEQFSDIRVSHIGENKPTHGFSTFQFLPFREHEVVALKTEEHRDKISTYIMVFDLNGQVLMEETFIGNVKFEGIEVV